MSHSHSPVQLINPARGQSVPLWEPLPLCRASDEKFTVQQGGRGRSSSRPLRRATYPAGVGASSQTPSLAESLRGDTDRFLGSSERHPAKVGGANQKRQSMFRATETSTALFSFYLVLRPAGVGGRLAARLQSTKPVYVLCSLRPGAKPCFVPKLPRSSLC